MRTTGAADRTSSERRAATVSAVPADLEALLHTLYKQHFQELARTARVLLDTSEAAHDAVHDAFVATYRSRPRVSTEQQLLAYLRVAVINQARSVMRRRRTSDRAQLLLETSTETSVDVESVITGQETDRELLAALRDLPARHQQVLIHRFLHGMNASDVAIALDLSESSVRSVQVRALRTLRKKLGPSR